MVVFIGFAALAIDLGRGYSRQRIAQNAADAAALAGMRLVREQDSAPTPMTGAQIYQAIQQVAARNGNAQLLPDAQGGAVFLDATMSALPDGNVQTWAGTDYSDVYALRVRTNIQYNTLFAGVFGRYSMTSGGVATAASFAPDMGGVLPVAFKTYAACGDDPDFGFESDPGPGKSYYDETNHWWKFFTNDPGVAGGFGWISLDGSSASASTVADWIVNGFHGTYSWWTNYRWDNGTGQYGGWTWNNGTGWYQANAPVADTTACNGYYDDGRSGSFDWTNPGPKPNSTPPPSWGTPTPPMPSGHDMVDTGSMFPQTGHDPNTLLGHPYIWMLNNTGMGLNSSLKAAISQMVGHDVMVFVYNNTDGTGSNAKLQIIGMAGFTIENVVFNGSNTEIWGLYRGAVLPGDSSGVLSTGMMTTVRLVPNTP